MGLHPTDLHRSLLVFRTTGVWRCSRLQSFAPPAEFGTASGCNLSLLLRGLALLPTAIFRSSGGVWRSSRLQSFAPPAGIGAASGCNLSLLRRGLVLLQAAIFRSSSGDWRCFRLQSFALPAGFGAPPGGAFFPLQSLRTNASYPELKHN